MIFDKFQDAGPAEVCTLWVLTVSKFVLISKPLTVSEHQLNEQLLYVFMI